MLVPAPDIAVFVGPTGVGIEDVISALNHPRILQLPPIARGDLEKLPPGITTALIVDGYFGSVPAVGHRELLCALEQKRVYGCSSLGAIRAFELRFDGMIGLGRIYDAFFASDDFMDDELALLHAPSPYYWPLSVPLINVRFALATLEASDQCAPSTAVEIVETLKGRYFGERTTEAVLSAAEATGGPSVRDALRAVLPAHDVKCQDLADALSLILGMTSSAVEVAA